MPCDTPPAIVSSVTPKWCAKFGGNSMTQRQTTRSRRLRSVGAVIAASIAISTVASTANAAPRPAAAPYGGTAKVAIFDTFSGWCFGNNLANSALMAGRTVYETLFEKTTDGKLVPLLAESATPSLGGLVWTLKLRTGITFHDGSAFNAAAVKANFDYITGHVHFNALQKEAKRLTPIALGGDGGAPTAKQAKAQADTIKAETAKGTDAKTMAGKALLAAAGAAESVSKLSYVLSTGAAFSTNILKITEVNSTTLTFQLQRAQNDLPSTLFASGRFFMRAPSQFEEAQGGNANECATNPIGTGPFKLETTKDWSTNKLTVIRNDAYWRSDAEGNKLPYLDGIVFQNIKEAPQRAAAITRGTYDAGMFSAAGEGANILSLRKAKAKELKSGIEYYPSLWLNQGKPGSPFANADARAAVVTCIDRAAFVKVRQVGQGKVATSLVGPASVMFSKNGMHKLNVRKAKAHVAAYKRATGKKTLSFTTPADVSSASQANIKFLQQQWKKCGINVVIKTSESADIIAKAFNASPNLKRGEHFNAYDSISILLFEGTDVGFNLPFSVTSAFSQGTGTGKTKFYGSGLCTSVAACATELSTAPAAANSAATRAAVYAGLGTVLGLNHHSDTSIDDCFFAEQAKTDPAASDYGQCTQKLIDGNIMTSVSHFYYTMFFSKKGKLSNYGVLKNPDGSDRRKMSNYGIDWTAVKKG